MALLFAVSLLWAFSFGLIKGNLAGLDPSFVACARLTLSCLVFLPFLRVRGLSRRRVVQLVAIGALEYGLMYTLYLASYRTLAAHEVALFTVTTPLFVVVFGDVLARRARPLPFVAAALAVAGAAVVAHREGKWSEAWVGLTLLQASNACFALGQVLYARVTGEQAAREQGRSFGLLFLGGVVVAGLAMLFTGGAPPLSSLTFTHAWTLAYLGVVASALGFFLWNLGATRTTPGVLAVMNDAKVPLGVLVAVVVFGEEADWPRLLGGAALLGVAVALAYVDERKRKRAGA